MKMKEAEIRSGLDRKNIRYYESEELLAPRRTEGNRYRDYSEEDIERLLEIRDNYPKYVLRADAFAGGNYEGIKTMHIADFLLSKEF